MPPFLRRFMPCPEELRRNRALRWLGPLLDKPWLWATNRRALSLGLAAGLFFGLLLPFGQSFAAAALVIWWRANLPVAVAATFISNPFTTPAIVAGAYYLGAAALGVPPNAPMEAGLSLFERTSSAGVPLLAGLGIVATMASVAGFLFIQVLLRLRPLQRLRRRRRAQCGK